MLIIAYTIWIAVLLLLIIGVFTFSNKNNAKYAPKKRNLLLVALTIQIVCSLALIAVFISAVFDAAASI